MINITHSVAILVDGNNIEKSMQEMAPGQNPMINFDILVPRLLSRRGLNRLIYFREGRSISKKLAERLHENFYGIVVPCHKSADIPLTIQATQIADKVDTIIILSGDSDYVELVRHLKSRGVRVEIAAVERTTAAILKEECDHFTAITMKDCFVLKPGPKKVKHKREITNTESSQQVETISTDDPIIEKKTDAQDQIVNDEVGGVRSEEQAAEDKV